jgi:O-antigen/teichoic acid export membrane protein
LWAALSAVSVVSMRGLGPVAAWYTVSGLLPLIARLVVAHRETGVIVPDSNRVLLPAIRLLLGYGSMVVLAQLADYLYAPTDYILIDHLLAPVDIANYAPALQMDAALLLLVAGLSSVLLPRTAVAHAAGDRAVVMRYFVRGTVVSLLVLAVMSAGVWALSPWIFRVWLGASMPETRRILPLLLVCTTLGGSSMVGRSILLAVGRVWPFTISVLIAGVTNVVCSYLFVTQLHWGLAGIVLGTVVAVVGRCAIWMPWYVWRVLSEGGEIGEVEDFPRDTGL